MSLPHVACPLLGSELGVSSSGQGKSRRLSLGKRSSYFMEMMTLPVDLRWSTWLKASFTCEHKAPSVYGDGHQGRKGQNKNVGEVSCCVVMPVLLHAKKKKKKLR